MEKPWLSRYGPRINPKSGNSPCFLDHFGWWRTHCILLRPPPRCWWISQFIPVCFPCQIQILLVDSNVVACCNSLPTGYPEISWFVMIFPIKNGHEGDVPHRQPPTLQTVHCPLHRPELFHRSGGRSHQLRGWWNRCPDTGGESLKQDNQEWWQEWGTCWQTGANVLGTVLLINEIF